jgi:RimJ/RimL family protein N-acetyltransferase
MKIEYEIIQQKDINNSHRNIFSELLRQQGKVNPPFENKANRCKLLCIVKNEDKPIAIGAIKEKTESDFSENKANLPNIKIEFDWELGYIFVIKAFEEKGIASNIVRLLLQEYGDENLMASTEISANPRMVGILEKNGFRHYGKPWKSSLHDNFLGLFLKYK